MILNLTIEADEPDELLSVGFLNTTSGSTRTEALSTGRQIPITLDPGRYLLRVTLPTGELVSEDLDVTDRGDATSLDLTLTLGTHTSDQTGTTDAADALPRVFFPVDTGFAARGGFSFESGVGWLGGALQQPPSVFRSHSSPHPLAGAWLRLWVHHEGQWEALSDPSATVTLDRYWHARPRITITIDPAPYGGLRLVAQIAAPEIPARLIALPTTAQSQPVTLTLTAAPAEGFEAGLAVSVRTPRPDVDSLVNYLASSQFTAAAAVLSHVTSEAADLLYHKVSDPNAAIVGGYFLLRIREFDQLHDWPTNLARVASEYPDGPLVRVGQILSSVIDADKGLEELRELLLGSWTRGFPVYTEGMRWLMLGIDALGSDDPGIAELRTAFKPYADAVDWSKPFTQFWGNSPGNPSFDRYPGRAGEDGTFLQLSDSAVLAAPVVNLEVPMEST